MTICARTLVVGGGLVGSVTALMLARAGIDTIHVAPRAGIDRRSSALMMPSIDVLVGGGLIEDPAALAHPLSQIRIIDATGRLLRAPETVFSADEAGLRAFGWNFSNVRLGAHLAERAGETSRLRRLEDSLVRFERRDGRYLATLSSGETVETALLVGADGKASPVRAGAGLGVREQRFSQAALVCDLELSRPLGEASVEFHYPNGPFTLVPAGGARANLVYIDDAGVLADVRALPQAALEAHLAARAQRLFGPVRVVSPVATFPLSTLSVPIAGRDGVVVVGEAAHAFPPIGAQGLNLGLRDAADLLGAARDADPSRPDWADTVSTDYAQRRAGDLERTGGMVDALFRSLLSEHLPAQALRAAGLWSLRSSGALRRGAFALGMGRR